MDVSKKKTTTDYKTTSNFKFLTIQIFTKETALLKLALSLKKRLLFCIAKQNINSLIEFIRVFFI